MFDQLNVTSRTAIAVAASVMAGVALLACLQISVAPQYPDFIVGSITWTASTKLQDLLAAPVFIAVLLGTAWVLLLVLRNYATTHGQNHANRFAEQLIWWSLPACAATFHLLLSQGLEGKLFTVSGIGIVAVSLACGINARRMESLDPAIIGAAVFSAFLFALIPLEVTLALGRALPTWFGTLPAQKYMRFTYILLAVGVLAVLAYAVLRPHTLRRHLPEALLGAQVGLPIFFLTLYPARLSPPDGVLIEYDTTIWLKVLIATMAIWGMVDVLRRYRRRSAANQDWTRLLSPIALFALLVALRAGSTGAPHINPDDYHIGEGLLGWWSYLHGAIPYLDYLPAHGLVDDDLPGFLSHLFYDGTAASLSDVGRLAFALTALAAFLSAYRFSGSIGLAFVSTYFIGGRLSWLFLASFLCVWLAPRLRARPAKWLAIWILSVPMVLLGVPAQGLLLLAATGPLVAYMAWRLVMEPGERKWKGIITALLVLVVMAAVTPLPAMLLGAIRYVAENGSINQVAYGVAWAHSWNGTPMSGLVFESIRMSWMAAPLICLVAVYASLTTGSRNKHLFWPALVALLFSLSLIPYSMGRIDPGGVSRPGLAAAFGWAVLVPIAAWWLMHAGNRILLPLAVTCAAAALNLSTPSMAVLQAVVAPIIRTPTLKDGAAAGLPNIGKAHVHDDHWDRLLRLNSLLGTALSPTQSYLDLTSRNAQYFYLNRQPPLAVPAPYNMAALPQQKRAVTKLAKSPPNIALLEGNNIVHDGGGLALRNPLLYRHVLDNYTPQRQGGFIVGYPKANGTPHAAAAIELFQAAFSTSDLGKIPVAWGQSQRSLADKMIRVRELQADALSVHDATHADGVYTPNGADPYIAFDLTNTALAGRDAGLLRFDFRCEGRTAPPRIQVFWWGDEDVAPFEASSLRFTAAEGHLIVPLEASPWWLLRERMHGLRIDLDNASACKRFAIENVELFQRVF